MHFISMLSEEVVLVLLRSHFCFVIFGVVMISDVI